MTTRRAPTKGERLRKTLVLRVLEANDAERTIVHAITERIVDRDGDVIEPRGGRFDNFQKNPVVLFGHDSWAFPVGKNLALEVHDQNITALTQFAGDAQAHPQAETAYRLARDGFLKAWSIGFMPITWSEDKALPGQDGWWFKEWELYEYSLVPIPSNPEALSRMVKAYGLPSGATEQDLTDALKKDRTPFWDLAGSLQGARRPLDGALATRIEAVVERLETAAMGRPSIQAAREPAAEETTMTPEELAAALAAQQKALGTLIDEKLKPVLDRVAAVETVTVKRVDADGKPVILGEQKAPAVLKNGLTDDKAPLLLTNYLRAMKFGNDAVMKEELAMSWRLRDAGYQAESGSSFLFPMGADLIVDQVDEKGNIRKDNSALRKEIAERLPLRRVDAGELMSLVRRSPELRKGLGITEKDLSILDDTLGGLLIPGIESTSIIDLLRPLLSVMRAGATEIALPPAGNLALPRLNADPAFVWADPDTVTDQATTNIGTGMVRLQAKSLRGFVTIPNDLIRYSSPAVEMVVRMALASRAAVVEDNAFLEAAGSSLQPKGIVGYALSAAEVPAAGKVTLHVAGTVATNGDTFTPEDLMKIIGLYYTGLDDQPATGWIMRPMLWTAIANRRADAVTAADAKGPFLFWTSRGSQGSAIPEALGGYPVFPTTNASNNRVKGSGTNLVYVLFGNFRRLIVGRSGAIELAASDQIKFLQDKTVIRAVLRSDSGLAHEESFVLTDSMLEA